MRCTRTTGTKAKRCVAAALALALAAMPLTGCGSQQTAGIGGAAGSQAEPDVSASWKTLGDALAAQTGIFTSGYNDDYYVCVLQAGDSYYRVVSKMDEEAYQKTQDVDWSAEDVEQQIRDAVSGLPLTSVEDVTGELMSQEELDALVGKTGSELADAGYSFAYYYMYGGDETGAAFDKGPFSYSFTFDVPVSEDGTDDGGAAVMDAQATQVEFLCPADSAVDPTIVE